MEFNISHLVMTITSQDNNFWSIMSSIGGIISAICAIIMAFLNDKTRKTAQEQTNEIKKQFQEENRPYITILPEFEKNLLFLSIQNIGKKIAENVKINIDDNFINQLSKKNEIAYGHLKTLKKSNIALGVGQKYITAPFNSDDLKSLTNSKMEVSISYKDYNKSYNQELEIDLSQYMWVVTSVRKSK